MIQPIETHYKGYRFRSRLEARWAVFFDALGIEYRYEAEGFDLDGTWYLPDFFLPKFKCWIEVKPDIPSYQEREKAIKLAIATDQHVTLLAGDVWLDVKGYVFSGFKREPEELQEMRSIVSELEGDEKVLWLSTHEFIARTHNWGFWGYNFERCYAWSESFWCECTICRSVGFNSAALDPHAGISVCKDYAMFYAGSSPKLMKAFTAARSARFEHGEKG